MAKPFGGAIMARPGKKPDSGPARFKSGELYSVPGRFFYVGSDFFFVPGNLSPCDPKVFRLRRNLILGYL
jgi:hypothetical protein